MGISANAPVAVPFARVVSSFSSASLAALAPPPSNAFSGMPVNLLTRRPPKGIKLPAISSAAWGSAAIPAFSVLIFTGCPRAICSSAWRSMLPPNCVSKEGTAAPAKPPTTVPTGPANDPRAAPARALPARAAMLGACSAKAAGI